MGIINKIWKYIMKRQNPMRYARKMGVVLGENCRLIGLPDWGSEPWLISIGNHTEVSFDVAFITHDVLPGVLEIKMNIREH